MNKLTLLLSLMALWLSNACVFAQSSNTNHPLTKIQQWQLLDYKEDTVYGMSVNKAYNELLKGKRSHPVIVAVLDEGVDITHQDLQGHIWTNTREIPDNGIDDDKNGYVDDVHGWNFLGGKDGRIMCAVSTEPDREYHRLAPKYGTVTDSSLVMDKAEYQTFLKEKAEHLEDSLYRDSNYLRRYQRLMHAIGQYQSVTQKQKVYFADVNSFQPADSTSDTAKKYLLGYYKRNPETVNMDLDTMYNGDPNFVQFVNELEKDQPFFAELGNDPYKLRKEIVGDNPLDINDRNYGNNNVEDSACGGHGTGCASIIAAIRDNAIGINGIADNVMIMPVRSGNAIGPGDEADKDVALGIRYAVDNGAKIISMSFGKHFSPNKPWIDDAIKYAAQKGVLLVHGAGNENNNIDSVPFYPYPEFLNNGGRAENFLNVGAISEDTGHAISTRFSNYGQKEVDVFAPGADINFLMPHNALDSGFGTSLSTPMVAGVAALILEYYPKLTAVELKDIIMRSVTSLKGKMVYKPGTQEKVDFATLCASGGVVNAYNALTLAGKVAAKKR